MDLHILHLVFYLLAVLCFAAYSFGKEHDKVNYLGLGVTFWALVPLTQSIADL